MYACMSSACLPLPASLPPLPASACLPQVMEGWIPSACLPLPACLPAFACLPAAQMHGEYVELNSKDTYKP